MSDARKDLGASPRVLRLAAALTGAVVALAGCGSGDDNGAADSKSKASAPGKAEPILIRTRVNVPAGKILDGSVVGDSPFCPGGTLMDQHGAPPVGLVDRTITCSDGTLRMGFDPQVPEGNEQRGSWRFVSGTGAYEGWKGDGNMVMRYDPADKSPHPTRGRERFTGTVTH